MDFVISSVKLDGYKSRKKLLVNLAYENYTISKDGTLTDILTVIPTSIDVKNGNAEESKSEIQLVRSKIKKPTFFENGSSRTIIKLTFLAVTDVEKLFNSIDLESLGYKGQNLFSLLKKINMGVSAKGAEAMMSVEDFVYKSTNVEYFEVEFSVGSILLEGDDKVIEVQTGLTSKSDYNVNLGDGSKLLLGTTFLRPPYDYE